MAKSRKLPEVSDIAFRVWVHLLPWTDSKGRFDNDALLIKSHALPRYEYRLEQIDDAVRELSLGRLIHLYDCGGSPYLVYHDHDEMNPPGKLNWSKPECPAPPPGLCECLTSADPPQERGASPPAIGEATSRHVLSSSSGGGGPGEEVERQMFQLALMAECPSLEATIRKHVKALRARSDVGAARLEAYLRSPEARGRTVNEWQEHFKPAIKTVKAAPVIRPPVQRVVDNCDECHGHGMVYSGKDLCTPCPKCSKKRGTA